MDPLGRIGSGVNSGDVTGWGYIDRVVWRHWIANCDPWEIKRAIASIGLPGSKPGGITAGSSTLALCCYGCCSSKGVDVDDIFWAVENGDAIFAFFAVIQQRAIY